MENVEKLWKILENVWKITKNVWKIMKNIEKLREIMVLGRAARSHIHSVAVQLQVSPFTF